MARPEKQGLDYFPFDIDFFEDEKTEAISGEFGIKGEIAIIKLLCAVYRNGYFIQWNEMLKMKLLKRLPGVSSDLLEQILNRLIKWGFFDEILFNSDKILTSKGIQSRFFQATKRRKTNEELPYLLVNVYNNTQQEKLLNTKTQQSKVKYSIIEEEEISTNVDTKKEEEDERLRLELEAKKEDQKKKLIAAKAATTKRKEEFRLSLVPFVDRYGKEMIRAFFEYWTEPNKSFTKMKYETEKTWDLALRLGTWCNRELRFKKVKAENNKLQSNIY